MFCFYILYCTITVTYHTFFTRLPSGQFVLRPPNAVGGLATSGLRVVQAAGKTVRLVAASAMRPAAKGQFILLENTSWYLLKIDLYNI